MSSFENILECAAQDGIVPGAVVFAKDKTGERLIPIRATERGADVQPKGRSIIQKPSLGKTNVITKVLCLRLRH